MQVGSLVELVNDAWPSWVNEFHDVLPSKNKIYTIRAIYDETWAVLLEEICSKINTRMGREQPFRSERFRELQPPMKISIEEILKQKI